MMEIIGTLIVGLIVGALARLALPGSQKIGVIGTLAVGVVGGLLGLAIAAVLQIAGGLLVTLLFAVLGAVLVLLVLQAISGRVRS